MIPLGRALAIVANLLLVLGLAGCMLAGSVWHLELPPAGHRIDNWLRRPAQPPARGAPPNTSVQPATMSSPTGLHLVETLAPSSPAQAEPTETPTPSNAEEAPTEPYRLPITRIEIPHLGVQSDVVPAPIVQVAGGTTWDVPPFVIGHGDNTAGAGETGNAVLIGHLVSPNAGSIFKDLFRMRVGDQVRVFSDDREYDYVVKGVSTVPRTDLSVLMPTDTASVTLLTCAGTWLPALQDFSHRLAVRAELASTSGAS